MQKFVFIFLRICKKATQKRIVKLENLIYKSYIEMFEVDSVGTCK